MPILQLEDVSLHYEFQDSNDRPVLLLSNSLGTNLDLWSEQCQPFSEYFSLLRYDMRGQGQSSKPPGPYTIAQLGLDVLALLNSLRIDRVHFCGISMGGLVGQWFGVHAPHRLHKLVLSNTAAKIGTEANWNQRITLVQSEGIEPIVQTVLKGWFTEPFQHNHPDVIAKMSDMLRANKPESYAACCAAVRDADLREVAATISMPTLVIYGTEDRSTTAEEAMFLIEHIRGAQGLKLNAAHISNIEAASAFTQGVLQFLRRSDT